MNIIIKLFLITTLIFSGLSSAADDDKLTDLKNDTKNFLNKEDVTLEQSTDNLTNRFISSTFGKDAYLLFEHNNITNKEEISTIDNKELSYPFKNLYPFLKYLFFSLLMISYILFLILIITSFIVKLSKINESAEFLKKTSGKGFSFIKIALVLVLMFPVVNDNLNIESKLFFNKKDETQKDQVPIFSASQALVFINAGFSNHFANEIIKNMVENQPKIYTAIKYPKSESKSFEFKKLIDFMVCIKKDESLKDNKISFDSYEQEEKIILSYNGVSSCKLTMSFGVDSKYKKIKTTNEEINNILSSFRENQIKNIIKFSNEAIIKADKISNILLLENPLEERNTELISFTNLNNQNNEKMLLWENECENVYNFSPVSLQMSKTEKEQYYFMASRCLSNDFNKYFMYKNEEQIKYLKTDNYLKNRFFPVCEKFQTLEDLSTIRSTAVANSVSGQVKENSTVSEAQSFFSFKSIEECVKEACSNISGGEFSNSYECSTSLNMFYQVEKDRDISKYGFLTLPAQINKIFIGFDNESSKMFYNNFEINNAYDDHEGQMSPSSINISINKSMNDFENENNLSNIQKKFFSDKNETTGLDLIKSIDYIGADRFANCVKNPLMIINGYSCSSITEEYFKFGNNLIYAGIQGKMILYSVSMLQDTKIVRKKPKKKNGGEVDDINGSTKTIFKTIGEKINIGGVFKASFALGLGYSASFFTDGIFKVDDFNEINSYDLNMIIQDEEFISVLLILGGTTASILTGFFNVILTGFLFLGILLAYIIPFIPFYLVLKLIIEWVVLFLSNILLSLLIPIFMTKESENHSNEAISEFIKMHLSLMVKIPFLVIGIFLAWIVINTVSARIFELFMLQESLGINYGQSITGIIDFIVLSFIYAIIIFTVTNISLGIMNTLQELSDTMLYKNTAKINHNHDQSLSVLGQIRGVLR